MAPKSKAQKMSLGDFLGDQTLGSWADEMEDMPLASESRSVGQGERRAVSSAAGFGDRSFDRGDRGPPREPLPLPTKPPFTAHLGNLPFDAKPSDIEDFFAGCEVTSVRIVEDKVERRPKGFGYVEFRTLDGLKKALELNLTPFQNRNIKISVADPPKDRPERGEARELIDWTRKGPLPDLPSSGPRRASDRGGVREAPDMERGGSRRGAPAFEGDGKPRDFNDWSRKGPLSPAPNAEPVRGNGRIRPNDGPRERKNSPSWGEPRSQEGSRPPRGEFRERPQPERVPTAAELDTEWRARMRPDPPVKMKTPTPEASNPSSPKQPAAVATASATATVRPKLNLQKRTVSEQVDSPATATTPSDPKSSPFGAARPIDTTAREREVEEKRQLVLRQKREAEDKAREEKRAKEAEAKPAAEENGSTPEGKANGSDVPNPTRNYQILRRVTDEENGEKEDEEVEEPPKETKPNGIPGEGKPTKPRGLPREPREHREPPRGPKHGGSWRQRKHSTPSPATPHTNNTEEDGWSTVGPTKGRGQRSRGGRPGGS